MLAARSQGDEIDSGDKRIVRLGQSGLSGFLGQVDPAITGFELEFLSASAPPTQLELVPCDQTGSAAQRFLRVIVLALRQFCTARPSEITQEKKSLHRADLRPVQSLFRSSALRIRVAAMIGVLEGWNAGVLKISLPHFSTAPSAIGGHLAAYCDVQAAL